jgi:hypothetical protein
MPQRTTVASLAGDVAVQTNPTKQQQLLSTTPSRATPPVSYFIFLRRMRGRVLPLPFVAQDALGVGGCRPGVVRRRSLSRVRRRVFLCVLAVPRGVELHALTRSLFPQTVVCRTGFTRELPRACVRCCQERRSVRFTPRFARIRSLLPRITVVALPSSIVRDCPLCYQGIASWH